MDPKLRYLKKNKSKNNYEYNLEKTDLYSIAFSFLQLSLGWKMDYYRNFKHKLDYYYNSEKFKEYDNKIREILEKVFFNNKFIFL